MPIFKLMCCWFLVASCGAALPLRAAADARPLAEALQVRRGAACLDSDGLRAQVAAWLGEEMIDRELSVRVVGSWTNARDVSFELRRGARRVASRRFFPAPEGCAQLEAILGLAIAMALKVSLRDELLALPARTSGSAVERGLAAFAELGLGLLPGTSAGVALRAELRALLTLRFDALSHTSQNQRLSAGPERLDIDAWLVGVRVAACLPLALSRALLVRACAGLGAGGLHIAGRGARGVRSAWLPWLDVGVGAELSLVVSERWSIDAGGNLELPLGDRSFGIRNADGTIATSRTLPDIAAALRAGPVYHF